MRGGPNDSGAFWWMNLPVLKKIAWYIGIIYETVNASLFQHQIKRNAFIKDILISWYHDIKIWWERCDEYEAKFEFSNFAKQITSACWNAEYFGIQCSDHAIEIHKVRKEDTLWKSNQSLDRLDVFKKDIMIYWSSFMKQWMLHCFITKSEIW